MQRRYTSDKRYEQDDVRYDSGEGGRGDSGRYAGDGMRNPAGEYRSSRYGQASSSQRRPAGYGSYRSASSGQGYAARSTGRYDGRYNDRYDGRYEQQRYAAQPSSGRYGSSSRSAGSRYASQTRAPQDRYAAPREDRYASRSYGADGSADGRYAMPRAPQAGQGRYAAAPRAPQSEYRRVQEPPRQVTRRPEPRRDDFLPESIRQKNAELRKKRVIVGVVAGIILIGVIVMIIALSSGGEGRDLPGVSKQTEAPTDAPTLEPTVEPAATLNIVANGGVAAAAATQTPDPTDAPDTIGNTNVNMGGVFGAGSTASTGGSSAGLRSATFRIAGDIMVTEEQLAWAKSLSGDYDFTENFTLITDSLANADYTMANMETTLGKYKGKAYSGYPCFNSPPEILRPLVASGVDYLNLANNHMLDRYFDGMKNTIGYVEYVGIDHSGAYPTQEARNTPKIIEVNGIKIGVVSYTHSTNGQEKVCSEDAVNFGVPYLYKADLEGDIQACRNAGAELVMAVVHWGEEYTHEPDDNQLKYAKKLAEYGADIIIGNHSHNIQPMGYQDVWVNGVQKKVFTIFSIGNFLTSHTTKDSYYSIILEFTINEQADGSFSVDNVGYVPTYCWIENEKVVIVPSAKYYNSAPSGMSDSEWQRMRATVQATKQMYGEFTMLEE